jgi:hypothetical protein
MVASAPGGTHPVRGLMSWFDGDPHGPGSISCSRGVSAGRSSGNTSRNSLSNLSQEHPTQRFSVICDLYIWAQGRILSNIKLLLTFCIYLTCITAPQGTRSDFFLVFEEVWLPLHMHSETMRYSINTDRVLEKHNKHRFLTKNVLAKSVKKRICFRASVICDLYHLQITDHRSTLAKGTPQAWRSLG